MSTKNKLEQGFNSGFLPPPTLEEEPKQWLAGTIPYQIVRPKGDWNEIKITGETQKFRLFDAMSCVSDSETNTEEKQITHFIENGVDINGIKYEIDVEKLKPWMDENGKINTSQRFLAQVSKTSPTGNSPMRVMDARIEFGLPPESVWSSKEFIEKGYNRTEYYKTPSKEAFDMGLEWKKFWDIYYERLPENPKASLIEYHLKQAPLWWASAVCNGWKNASIVQNCSLKPSHMHLGQMLTKEYKGIYDSYDPFDKKVALNYRIYFPYKVVVIPKPLILKKKGEENDMPIFYKVKGLPKIYQLGADGLYHHIVDEPVFKGLYGDFDKVEIRELSEIVPESEGFTIMNKQSLIEILINYFKGK